MKPRILLALIAVLSFCPSSYAAPDAKRAAACAKRFTAAVDSQVFTDVDVRRAAVVVGRAYFRLSWKKKKQYVEVANCAFTRGDETLCREFWLRHWQSDQIVGRFHNCRLRAIETASLRSHMTRTP